jgi:hypothetical protein
MRLVRDLSWACLVVAVAAFLSPVVRNVTEALVAMTSHQSSMVVAQQPNR